jgi:hypothetical protein
MRRPPGWDGFSGTLKSPHSASTTLSWEGSSRRQGERSSADGERAFVVGDAGGDAGADAAVGSTADAGPAADATVGADADAIAHASRDILINETIGYFTQRGMALFVELLVLQYPPSLLAIRDLDPEIDAFCPNL